jgi:hypothetical protein
MLGMHLRELNIGCVGGGTGLPSLLGGLKSNPWLRLNAVVTMFDSGGSSGQLRDQLGVLPPGDVLKCALALSRNEREARNVLLARLPALDPRDRLGGHTWRQPVAVDDGALQRRLSLGGGQSARAPRVQGSRLAGHRRIGVGLRGVRRRHPHARGSGGRRRAVTRSRSAAALARASGSDSP